MRTDSMDLLEFLAAKAGCIYLSDLRQPYLFSSVYHTLKRLDAEAFSLREWNDAATYLTQKPCSFESPEQARQYLLNGGKDD